jgi:hypothetical protein
MIQILLNQVLEHFGIIHRSEITCCALLYRSVLAPTFRAPGAYSKKGSCCKEEGRDIIVSLAAGKYSNISARMNSYSGDFLQFATAVPR